MKMRFSFLLFMIVLGSSLLFSQGTTGTIRGKITEENGTPLPGVSVTVLSNNLIGTRSVVSDEKGSYIFVRLPPGSYMLIAKLDGFETKKVENIKLALEATISVNILMKAGKIDLEVTVTAEKTVDPVSSTLSTNIRKEFFDTLPKGRDFQSMVYIAPSVVTTTYTDAASGEYVKGIGIAGSTGAENQFIIDGLNTTGVMRGSDNIPNIVYEFVEEVQVKTGGYEAEYGGALGGVINVITRSGGNEFHGSVRLNYQSDKLSGKPKIGFFGGGAIDKFNYSDLSAALGGYILKDKLWFFAAYSPSIRTTTYNPTNLYTHQMGDFKAITQAHTFSGKLSFIPNQFHTLTVSYFGDPGRTEGGNPGGLIDWNSNWKPLAKSGSTNIAGKYDGTFGSDLLVHFLVGRYHSNPEVRPLNGNMDEPVNYYFENYLGYPSGWQTGGFGRAWTPNPRERWTLNGDIAKYWGRHMIKGGIQYLRYSGERNEHDSGGRYYQYYADSNELHDKKWATKGNAFTEVLSFFIQDSWELSNNFQLNLGLRIEDQKLHATDPSRFFEPHETILHFTPGQMISPRIGFTYDPRGDGKSKIFASYGRFYEMIPLDINVYTFGYIDSTTDIYNLSTGDYITGFVYMGGGTDFADAIPGAEKMKAPYVEELILGFERAITAGISLSVRGLYRRIGMIIEDGSFNGGETWFVFNPGIHYKGSFDTDPMGFPACKRNYMALEGVLNGSSERISFNASYTLSLLKGNYAGLVFPEAGQNNPNISCAFDMPDFMFNSDGYLPGDRRHQFKFNGIYSLPFGFQVGGSFSLYTGEPLSKIGTNLYYGPMVFLEPRGTSGRLPTFHQLDLHLEKDIRLKGRYSLSFYADIFNVLNTKIKTAEDMIYARNTYYGDYGQGIPAPWVPAPQPDNPYYGKATMYQAPFGGMIGLKFQF